MLGVAAELRQRRAVCQVELVHLPAADEVRGCGRCGALLSTGHTQLLMRHSDSYEASVSLEGASPRPLMLQQTTPSLSRGADPRTASSYSS